MIESWLNGQATNATRGRLLATYMIVVTVGIGSGQLLLGVADVVGPTLFAVSAMLMSLSVVPLALWQVPTPLVEVATRISIRALARTAPLGVATGVLVGASNGAIYGLGAVYATKVGMSPGRAGLFVGVSIFGALITQYPLGHLSDRLPRRRVILGVAAAATLTAGAGIGIEPEGWLIFVVAAVYGSLAFPMYSLAVSHINDVARGDQLVATAAGVLFVYGMGSIAGPIIASILMTIFGPVGYFWSLAAFFSPIVVFSFYRIATRARPEQQRFVNVSATTPLETRLAGAGVDAGADAG
jgi:MFS family permease